MRHKNLSAVCQKHRHKLRLEELNHNLDLLYEQIDSLPLDHADRPRLIREI